MTPISASVKSNGKEFHYNLKVKGKKEPIVYIEIYLNRAASTRCLFSKNGNAKYGFGIFSETERIDDTKPTCRLQKQPEIWKRFSWKWLHFLKIDWKWYKKQQLL